MIKSFSCHDCEKKAEINGDEIENGVMAVYEKDDEKFSVFKCSDCFKKSKKLDGFQKCEVYSRVVGYLRPVNQWHTGKQQEFKERKEYKTS